MLVTSNGPDKRTNKQILDEINEVSSVLEYCDHRLVQQDLCVLLQRLPCEGKWIIDEDGSGYECDKCHSVFDRATRFCSYCGSIKLEGQR